MQDVHRITHFDLTAERPAALTPAEELRIRETAGMVPDSWRRNLDVGCGDGRVSRELMSRGFEMLGIDWSANSVAHFPGETRVCDIREPWPFSEPFDGAICCEVLEHLEPSEAAKVVANLKKFTRLGFLITVPAREGFCRNVATCQSCGKDYNVYGHCQRFRDFAAVDAMVGRKATARKLIRTGRGRVSERLVGWQKRLGFTPWAPSYICPHCGAKLRQPPPPPLLNRLANKGVSAVQRTTSLLRQPGGWFACRYEA